MSQAISVPLPVLDYDDMLPNETGLISIATTVLSQLASRRIYRMSVTDICTVRTEYCPTIRPGQLQVRCWTSPPVPVRY